MVDDSSHFETEDAHHTIKALPNCQIPTKLSKRIRDHTKSYGVTGYKFQAVGPSEALVVTRCHHQEDGAIM